MAMEPEVLVSEIVPAPPVLIVSVSVSDAALMEISPDVAETPVRPLVIPIVRAPVFDRNTPTEPSDASNAETVDSMGLAAVPTPLLPVIRRLLLVTLFAAAFASVTAPAELIDTKSPTADSAPMLILPLVVVVRVISWLVPSATMSEAIKS